jgi:hypothetical protein
MTMGNFGEHFVELGRIKGQTWALVRLLEKRFGPIPSSLHERILASDLVSIDAWFDRAMEALFDRPLEAIELQWVFEPKELPRGPRRRSLSAL